MKASASLGKTYKNARKKLRKSFQKNLMKFLFSFYNKKTWYIKDLFNFTIDSIIVWKFVLM